MLPDWDRNFVQLGLFTSTRKWALRYTTAHSSYLAYIQIQVYSDVSMDSAALLVSVTVFKVWCSPSSNSGSNMSQITLPITSTPSCSASARIRASDAVSLSKIPDPSLTLISVWTMSGTNSGWPYPDGISMGAGSFSMLIYETHLNAKDLNVLQGLDRLTLRLGQRETLHETLGG